MIDLFFIRHGEAASIWGSEADPGLSQKGQQQARNARDNIKLCEPVDIYTSPLNRAIETSRVFTPNAIITPELRELPSYWVPSSQKRAWLRTKLSSTWSAAEPEIQVWRQSLIRWAMNRQHSCYAFTHFIVINALISQAFESDKVLVMQPDYCSIAHFQTDGERLKFIGLNRQLKTNINL